MIESSACVKRTLPKVQMPAGKTIGIAYNKVIIKLLTLPILKQWEGKYEENTICFISCCLFYFSNYAESLADEKKTITPQEFAQNY